MNDYKTRILSSAKEVPIYTEYLNPLKMSEKEKEQQRQELQNTFGIKKAINYKNFNSLQE